MEWLELSCQACDWRSQCGPPQMLHWLRAAEMVRRDAAPEPDLLGELLRSAAHKLVCPKCQATGLLVTEPADESDDEVWGQARACAACGNAIPSERLEIFPHADLCASCQAKCDRGEAVGAPEYCPRCGNIMTLKQSRRGVTRYVMACTSCRS